MVWPKSLHPLHGIWLASHCRKTSNSWKLCKKGPCCIFCWLPVQPAPWPLLTLNLRLTKDVELLEISYAVVTTLTSFLRLHLLPREFFPSIFTLLHSIYPWRYIYVSDYSTRLPTFRTFFCLSLCFNPQHHIWHIFK